MNKSRLLGSVCAYLFSIGAHAEIIDFQILEINDTTGHIFGNTYSEDGYTLNNLSSPFEFNFNGTQANWYHGSTALFNNNIDGITELTRTDGGLFNLLSIDLTELGNPREYCCGHIWSGSATFVGEYSSGGNIAQTFELDGIAATGSGFETFIFSGFSNLTRVTWLNEEDFHQFDNIVVNNVPIPASVWLFGSGLLGLIGVARKKAIYQ